MGKYFVKYTVAHHYELIPPIIREHTDIIELKEEEVSMTSIKEKLGNDRWDHTAHQTFSSLREILSINKL